MRTLSLLALGLALAACESAPAVVVVAPDAGVDPDVCLAPCPLLAIGEPTWVPVDVSLFSTPVGDATNRYAEFLRFVETDFYPAHPWYTDGQFGPGTAHAGPYDTEIAERLSSAGIVPKRTFTPVELSSPNGIVLLLTLAPAPSSVARGSSPDGPDGPILPARLFPMYVDGDVFREGVLLDPANDSRVGAPDMYSPPVIVDGWSHVLVGLVTNNRSFVRGTVDPGSFVFRVTLVDNRSNGWRVQVPFTVE
jgi:hypothetical protein